MEKYESPKPVTPTGGDRYDNDDVVTEFYHSSDDGLEAVDIPLDDPSERSPLIQRSGNQSPRSSSRETTEPNSPLFRHDEISFQVRANQSQGNRPDIDPSPMSLESSYKWQEMQQSSKGSTKRLLSSQGSDIEMEDRLD